MGLMDVILLIYVGCHKAKQQSGKWYCNCDHAQLSKRYHQIYGTSVTAIVAADLRVGTLAGADAGIHCIAHLHYLQTSSYGL